MAITGDHFTCTYEGHSIELIRDTATLKLFGDGKEAASLRGTFEGSIGGSFEHGGVRHTVTAKAASHFLSSEDTIEVDGSPLPLKRTE